MEDAGSEMHAFAADLYPIPRSLTGEGVRETLGRIRELIPLEVHEVPSGTPVLDWTVPKEWSVREAWIRGPDGERVLDLADSNLHLVGYSVPVHERMALEELRDHVFTLPDQPDWIPYRTSYYTESWGFCMSHRRFEELPDGEYEVMVDSSLDDGSLSYGECYLPGEDRAEVLVSCHVCHPSLANDNLSGIAVATQLARVLADEERRLSYRFLFIPGTIGSITWLARNRDAADRIRHGLVLTCVGDPGHSTYKRSRRGDAEIDRAVEHVLAHSGARYEVQDFFPYGYDERQYCSPGFDLAVGCLMRTPHGRFPEYHTSADDLSLIRPEHLADSLEKVLATFELLESNATYRNLAPFGEPQLGRRGLYGAIGGAADRRTEEMAMLWVLNQSDGRRSLLDIAERAQMPFDAIARAAERLVDSELLEAVSTP